jgi:putative tryptophan/tyrosine transport system substrate-binding protein
MRRREFIASLGAAAWPVVARAQQPANPMRIGVLPVGSPSNAYDRSLVEAFRLGLHEAGVIENRDVVLDIVWTTNEPEIPEAVNGLMQRGAKLLVPSGTSSSVVAKRQVSTIPIIFIAVGNPIGVGLVESLPRPNGNVTGFSDMYADLGGKFVQFASELGKPRETLNYLWYTGWEDGRYRLQVTEQAAQSFGVELRSRGINDIAEANDVMAELKADGAVVLIIEAGPFTLRHRRELFDIAMNHRLATIQALPAANDGALIAFGPDLVDLHRRAGSYVERVLKGTKPADLPVQQPTKFRLVINVKTANALGLTVPNTLLVNADEVIE